MRLGVFGGSFNPPHHCHVLAVGLALSSGEVDRVAVIPTHTHPFDKPLAPYRDRMEMCQLAFRVFRGRVVVSDLEARIQGPNYTIDTLRALAREGSNVSLRLILGADLLDEVDRWKDFDEVVALAPPLWIGREGREAPGDVIFPFQLPDVSSTEIRRCLATGDAPQGLVPAGVRDYIRAKGLYAADPATRRVLILGLGKVGTVLARWLSASGAAVRGWDPVPVDETVERALKDAGVAVAVSLPDSMSGEGGDIDLVIVAAPDKVLGVIPRLMDDAGIPGDVPAVHCSGSAPARILESGDRPVGRMHPVFPFASPELPLSDLRCLHLVIEGDSAAAEAASDAIVDAGGVPINVSDLDAPRYHAACVMAANHLAALGMAAEDLAGDAGVRGAEASAALRYLMEAALRNSRRQGFRESLTGPAARGDDETIRGHLDALADSPEEIMALYRAANSVLDIWLRRRQDMGPTEG